MLLSTFAMLRWWPCIVLANEMTQHHLMLRHSLKCKGSFKDVNINWDSNKAKQTYHCCNSFFVTESNKANQNMKFKYKNTDK